MTITPVAWFDPFELICSLRTRLGQFKHLGGWGGRRIISIRGPAVDAADPEDVSQFIEAKSVEKWVELKNMLGVIERFNAERLQIGRVYLEMLDPGVKLPWGDIPDLRFTLPLRTNPYCWLYGAGVAHNPAPGALVVRQGPASAVNLGVCPYIALVMDARPKPDQA